MRNAAESTDDGTHVSMETLKRGHIRSAFTTSCDTQRSRSRLLFISGRCKKVNKFELIELVKCYKYLGIWIDDFLNFKPHVLNPVRKLRLKLGFYFRNESCFSFNVMSAFFFFFFFYLYWTMGIFCTCMPLLSVSI